MWVIRNGQKGLNAGKYISVSLALCADNPRDVTHGPHIGAALGKTFPNNDVILCTAFDPLSVQDDTMIPVWKFRNALKSNLKKNNKSIPYRKINLKYISSWKGIILSHPQSIAAETWLSFQVCKLLYLIQISPEVRNEIEECLLQNRGHFVSATMC